MKQNLTWILLVLLLLATASLSALRASYLAPLKSLSAPQLFVIESGSSLGTIARELKAQNIVSNIRLLKLAVRLLGTADAIKAGEYRLEPGLSMADLVALLVSGEVVQYRITFIEGWTLSQALAVMTGMDALEHTLADTNAAQLASLLSLDLDNPEGMLHPDTYFFTRGTSDLDILRRARDRQQQILDELWQTQASSLPYKSATEALIMASIIEKEAGVSSEKGHIAGVFVRRLEKNMRLQSDPTVIYGLGVGHTGKLTRADLNTMTPYNTYRINGLPPTPIALPGTDSIKASLNPLPSDYLYFVATGDGRHKFSATLEEHNVAVNQYRRMQQENQQHDNKPISGQNRQCGNDE